jgi:hypothetical protein
MHASRFVYTGAISLTLAVALGFATSATQAAPNSTPKIPVLRVDPDWPKLPLPVAGDFGTPLEINTATGKPKPWVTGEVAGTCVDSRDNVFTVNRGNLVSPETVEAVSSPTVIEYDPEGNVVSAWNTSANQAQIHGCFVDYQDNIWIGGNGDGIVQKYTHDGKTLLLQIGTKGVCDWPANNNACGNSGGDPTANQSHTLLNEPANVWVDPGVDPQSGKRGAVYIADGYGNHRVVVFQDNGDGTATYLRQWPKDNSVATTVNNPLTDFPGLFAAGDGGHPHCVVGGNDGLIYVCDRADDRIQVFTKLGGLVRIIPVVPGTGVTQGIGGAPGLGTAGSAWDLRFTNDAMQTYMFEIDGGNEMLHTMSRALGTIVSSMGQPGHQAGQFTFLHSNTVDSKGNVYTGETINGRRIQKFVHVQCNNGNGRGNGNGNCS